ncbi:uncharacterized protein SEPMUDRAFT_136540 [Sphaerulina musiva SO2202]|uniref:Uncharacterized protein n=1 Tax=Sphaerulina musiva (strain SO2202) TaxID=692275 RepID=M3BQE6_SPHMS|nr:uncharacterized protein SEPMUDRAFT_136540 [Sphaerulina musiva SO2202]EMF08358.1 hypothetical protein SEPMUDRAFT_136540 [Sphaerulina musiva SO2202]
MWATYLSRGQSSTRATILHRDNDGDEHSIRAPKLDEWHAQRLLDRKTQHLAFQGLIHTPKLREAQGIASQDEQHMAAHFTTQIWIQSPTVPQRQVRGCLAWAFFRTISEAEIQSSGKSGDVDDVATPPPVHAIENIAIEPLGRAQLTDLCAEVGPGRACNLVLWRDQAPTQ